MRLADVRAIRYGDVLVEGQRWPGFLHVVEHPQGRVLVDTGLIDSTPELDAEWSPRFDPDAIPRDVVCVINTHLHFDHCGGNRLFAGTPIYVQRLASAKRLAQTATRLRSGSSSRARPTWNSRANTKFCPEFASSRRRATRLGISRYW
jgi:glyoxylase-like metal-dependent hydrolase (beta-lactamase superfamily II)